MATPPNTAPAFSTVSCKDSEPLDATTAFAFEGRKMKTENDKMKIQGIACLALLVLVCCMNVPAGQIALPEKPCEAEKFAAEELRMHLALVGYGELPVRTGEQVKEGDFTFWIGRAGLSRLPQGTKLPRCGFVLRTIPGGLVFAGDDTTAKRFERDAASAYAVYEFLEREFGVRWIYPGKDGIVFQPADSGHTLREYDIVWETPFPLMVIASFFTPFRNKDPWSLRTMRPISVPWSYVDNIGHAFTKWYKEYGTTHPDWFARPSDKVPDKVAKLTAMCVSNEGFQDELVARWLRAREKRPGVDFIINCQENDTAGDCRCSKCMSWNGEQRQWSFWPEMMDTSNRYQRFYREVRSKASKYDPNVKTIGYAYKNYPFAPKKGEMHPNNIILVVTPSGIVQFPYTPKHKKELHDWAAAWRDSGATIVYRPNIFNGYVMPENTVRDYYDEFQTFRPSLKGICVDGPNASWATAGPQCYVLARLAVHPDASLADLLEEYYSGFGPAAPAIREYWEHWEKYTYDHAQEFYDIPVKYNYGTYKAFFGFNYAWYAHRLFPQEVFAPGMAILDKAAELAKDSPSDLRRVMFLKEGLENARRTAKTCEIFADDKYTNEDRVAALESIHAFRSTLSEFTYCKSIAESNINEKRVWSFSDFDATRMVMLPIVWKLKLDPKNVGTQQKFYNEDISQWLDVKTDRSLENNGHTQSAFSWFALDFTIPRQFQGKRTELVLGAVDENCQLWINGQQAGSFRYDPDINPNGYAEPITFDITRFLKPGVNRVAVNVINEIGHGGLWKVSRLQFYNQEEPESVQGSFKVHQEKLETSILGLGKTAFLVNERPDGTADLKFIGASGPLHSRYAYYRVPIRYLAGKKFRFAVEARLALTHGKGSAHVELRQYNNRRQLIGKWNRLDIPANREMATYEAVQEMLPEAVSAQLFFYGQIISPEDFVLFRNFTIEPVALH